jgi:hypothetical protein
MRAARRQRVALVASLGAVALVITIVAVVVATGRDGPDPAPAVVPPSAPVATAAVAIVTEPAGAAISVDGTARGIAPLNIAAPAGAEIEIRAELTGHTSTSERVRVGTEPATVRVTLAQLTDGPAPVVDAGIIRAPAIDAGARPRRTGPRPGRGTADTFDPDGVVQP